jgi:hypothetical protein
MNGVRRFLGGGGNSSTPSTPEPSSPPALPSTAPLFFSNKPNWPPSSPTESNYTPSPPTTAALSFAKKRSPLPSVEDDPGNSSFNSSRSSGSVGSPVRQNSNIPQSPGAGPSSPSRSLLPYRVSQLSGKSAGYESKRSSQMLNIRDDLLIDLLASEAIVDSRDFQILSAEEVEELKKVR